MTTTATTREKRDPVFAAVFRGISAAFVGIPMHDCPYEARTGEADAWELAHGRTEQMLSDRESDRIRELETDKSCLVLQQKYAEVIAENERLLAIIREAEEIADRIPTELRSEG